MNNKTFMTIKLNQPDTWDYYSTVRDRFYTKLDGSWFAFVGGYWRKWFTPLYSTRISFVSRDEFKLAESEWNQK